MEGAPGAIDLEIAALASSDAPDDSLFADGTRAINESRWVDAAKLFSTAASQHGEHADGALYWKAYAEDKLNQSKAAEDACAELSGSYPKSKWIDDCGALEVEIRSKTGQPIEIEPGQSDDVKLLALNAMMRQNEARALAEIQAILNGDASDRLKKEAEVILGQHYSDATYAQIVRISYVEGDVRIQRGAPNGKPESAVWEQAVADLPLETGFSLATGAGRAEIEFENASTIYLGENSVLTFNDLHATAGVPYTELALLSGTVSLNIHPYVAGEKFVLRTPTDDFISRYPDTSHVRIESFTDAVTLTPLAGGDLRLPGVARDDVRPGRTWTYHQGLIADPAGAASDEAFSAWDTWVANRVAQRDAAIAAVMEASGLLAAIPGMADLAGQGKFFPCEPYGTCWEPNEDGEENQTATRDTSLRPGSLQPNLERQAQLERPSHLAFQAHLELAAYHPVAMPIPVAMPAESPQATTARPSIAPRLDDGFPCTPGTLRYRIVKDPSTGKQVVSATALAQSAPYDWALCHAGGWIRHNKRYVWVANCKRHHVDPVRWVKSDHKIAFVPLHPYDVKGQPPINVKHVVFEVSGKSDIVVRPAKLEPNHPVEYLQSPPKEYRVASLQPLAHIEPPHMEAHVLVNEAGVKGNEISRAAIPIRFDPKSQSFTMPRQEMRGGKSETVFAPITNRTGSLQARGEGFGGGSGFRGSAGSSGGYRGGGTSSSGGHSTSGSSSASSGSHSSGGGSSSSSGGSSSSAASSSGGSHH
jgi:hypothetical protein